MIDKSKILTRAKLNNQGAAPTPPSSFIQNFGGDPRRAYQGVEDTDFDYIDVLEFEFDGFSVVVENGVFAVQYEDPEDGLVVQNLAGEGETEPGFPYLFEADGAEKVLTEEDYLRVKNFMEKG